MCYVYPHSSNFSPCLLKILQHCLSYWLWYINLYGTLKFHSEISLQSYGDIDGDYQIRCTGQPQIFIGILIISMHVHNLGMESIYSYSLVNGLFRYAVPFFFIVNGYFLIASIEKSGFYTWVKRVIILYTLWMIIYLPIYYKQFDIHTSTGKLDLAITMLLGFHHLWYLVAMFVGGVLLFWPESQIWTLCWQFHLHW